MDHNKLEDLWDALRHTRLTQWAKDNPELRTMIGDDLYQQILEIDFATASWKKSDELRAAVEKALDDKNFTVCKCRGYASKIQMDFTNLDNDPSSPTRTLTLLKIDDPKNFQSLYQCSQCQRYALSLSYWGGDDLRSDGKGQGEGNYSWITGVSDADARNILDNNIWPDILTNAEKKYWA